MYNWDNFKVRCSSIVKALANSQSNPVLTENQAEKLRAWRDKLEAGGQLTEKQKLDMVELEMKEKNGEKIVLSDGYIEYLMIEYAEIVFGMISTSKESLELLAAEKGKQAEEDGLNLLRRVDRIPYKIHKERIFNDFLSGEIDAYDGPEVYKAEIIADIKNSWDSIVFLRKLHSGLANGQKEQVQGYMDITGADRGWIVNTLVDTPLEIVEEMKWKCAKKAGAITIESPDFLKIWEKWEHSMKFNHIPPNMRVNKIPIERFSDHVRQRLYDRVKHGRDFLEKFHETYQRLNLV